MKKIFLGIVVAVMFIINSAFSQNINWKSFSEEQKQFVDANVGFDNGFCAGLGYGYKLKTKLPIILNLDYSSPLGNKLVDDFKTKLGGQTEVFKVNNFAATIKVYGIFRRFQSRMVTLANFGSDLSGVLGYYKSKWYVAGEFGFDKAIATHIKNSPLMRENYAAVQDGWYVPTAGSFYYGLQMGYSFTSYDINLKIGKTITQDLKSTATIPMYMQIGVRKRF